MTEPKKNTWLMDNLPAVLAILGVLGVGGYQATSVDEGIRPAELQVEIELLKSQMNEAFSEEVTRAAVGIELGSMRGLEGQEAIDYVNGLMDFADEKVIDDSIWQNYYRPKLDALIERFDGACGYCAPGERLGEMYFIDCFGQPKRIQHAKLDNTTKPIYYYRNDNDQVIPVRYLNTFIE